MELLRDRLGRPLRDLRISVTDRCNLRCTYCMPAEVFGPQYAFLPREELLTFEEITRLARVFVRHGVTKLRLTGGEPLLRRDLSDLIRMLATIDGVQDIALTTNGLLLPHLARPLKDAGLHRVTVSLDALDPAVFGRMNGLNVHPDRVIAGMDAALTAGLKVKVNTVVQRGVNDDQVAAVWEALKDRGPVRFIEFMDVGNTNGWQMEHVVPSGEVLARLPGDFQPVKAAARGEVADRYRDENGREVGLISSVTAPFCGDCTRARISAQGSLYTCLFASEGTDLRALLRDGTDDEGISRTLRAVWENREDRYSEQRGEETAQRRKIEMSAIGG